MWAGLCSSVDAVVKRRYGYGLIVEGSTKRRGRPNLAYESKFCALLAFHE